MARSIRIVRGALDEVGRDIVLRGVVDPPSLDALQVDDYQRETLSNKKIAGLMQAILDGRVPDLDLGMRGQRFEERPGGVFILRSAVFIVDGLQRVTAGLRLMAGDPNADPPLPPFMPHIGAVVHFDTTESWERMRFEALNLGQTKLSPNVTLRNQRPKYPVAELLWQLTHDPDFVLNDRVTWTQNTRQSDLMSATMLFHAVGRLHSHVGPGNYRNVLDSCEGLQRIMDRLGSTVFEANVRTFFGTIDACWSIREVAYREGAVQLRDTFLKALSRIFSDHLSFWQGQRLLVPVVYARKLRQFPLTDPYIKSLASASGQAETILRNTILEHLNRGRNRLRPRQAVTGIYESDEVEA